MDRLTARAFNALNRSSRSCALLEAPLLFEARDFSDSSLELLGCETSASSFVALMVSFVEAGPRSIDDILMRVDYCYWSCKVLLTELLTKSNFVSYSEKARQTRFELCQQPV